MAHPTFLTEFLIILIIATFVAVVFDRARLPSVLGFLLTGVVIGPQGLGLLSDVGRIYQMAEIGVVLLMLTIGLEFSIDHLKGLRRIAIFGGGLQLLLSIGIGILFAMIKGWTVYSGFFLGSVIALSSTAIVLKYLIDRGELDTTYGRIAIGILLFQDFAVVPLMVLTTGFGQPGEGMVQQLGLALFKTVLLIVGVVGFANFVLPHFLRQVARSRNREIFFLTAIVISLGTAWLSGYLGLSLAIGAFFAGFMFANTDYGHQLIGDIVPFRHVFVSIFFVSIGLLFDVSFARDHFLLIGIMVGLVILVNFVLMTLLLIAFKYPPRVALVTGLILSQIGEFSFLLLEAGRSAGGIQPFFYQALLSTAFLTILLTPFLFALVPAVLKMSEKIPFFGIPPDQWKKTERASSKLKSHVILCGFGPSGRDLAQSFLEEDIPFVVLEMNPKKIHLAHQQKLRVIYGDAANAEVMRRAGIDHARAVIVSFADPIGMEQIIRVVQSLNPDTFLVVRTRYEREIARLYEKGADLVVMEELEASQELNRTLLSHFKVSPKKIEHHLERIRARKELLIEEAIMRRKLKDGV